MTFKGLEKLLDLFFEYERAEITEFRKAVEQFKADLPMVLEALRSMIERAHKREPEFRKAAEEFLKHAQEAINPRKRKGSGVSFLDFLFSLGETFSKIAFFNPSSLEGNVFSRRS